MTLASTGRRTRSPPSIPAPLPDHVSVVVHGDDPPRFLLSLPTPPRPYREHPNTGVLPGETWIGAAQRRLHEVANAEVAVDQVARICRPQLSPRGSAGASHVVFVVRFADDLLADAKTPSDHTWMTTEEVIEASRQEAGYRSPELLDLLAAVAEGKGASMRLLEMTPGRSVVPVDLAGPQPRSSTSAALLHASKFGMEEQMLVYDVFVLAAYPFQTLRREEFASLMVEAGWPEEEAVLLFRAADVRQNWYLGFKEFLLAMAATDPATPHGGPAAEARCKLIFRYYDTKRDSRLDREELFSMMKDIMKKRGPSPSDADVDAELQSAYQQVFKKDPSKPVALTMGEFLSAVGTLKFRGTSALLRSPAPTMDFVKERLNAERTSGARATGTVPATSVRAKRTSRGRTAASGVADGREGYYELATHSVKVRRTGSLIGVNALWDFQGTQALPVDVKLDNTSYHRMSSLDSFNMGSVPNQVLSALKYFEKSPSLGDDDSGVPPDLRADKPPYNWGKIDRMGLARSLIALCNLVKDVFCLENRLVEISSPAYVLGDLHGNYQDLMCFERVLWRLGPILTPAAILLLGDYVDRGAYGVEVVAYLFAQKVLAPKKFHILRGNHELRDVQCMFHFRDQCMQLFDKAMGVKVWEACNMAFDHMPLAAVIDRRIYCCHGGIFPPTLAGGGLLSAINSIPCPLSEPETQSPLAWEILWNDPLSKDGSYGKNMMALTDKNGFAPNTKRGTAHVFDEAALEQFLSRNNLSHVIRAHEVQQAGFQIQQKGRILTVFSSSAYCGGTNEAACILCESYKLRVIRLDTQRSAAL